MGGDLALSDDRGTTLFDEYYAKSWFIGFSSLPASIQTWVRNNDERSGTLNGLQKIGLPPTTGTRGTPEDIEEDKKKARFWQWFLDQVYGQRFAEIREFISHIREVVRQEIATLDQTIEEIEETENSGNEPPGARAFLKQKKKTLKQIRNKYVEFDQNVLQPATDTLDDKENPPSIEELEDTGEKVKGLLGRLRQKTADIFKRGTERAINGFRKYRAKGEASSALLLNDFAASAGNDNSPEETDQDDLSDSLPTDELNQD